MKRKNTGAVLPVPTNADPSLVTEPKRQLGGPQSGLPPAFEIASELAPFLIVGIDFGTHDCRVATFMDGEPRPLKLSEIESKIHFEGYATDSKADLATAFDVKTMLGKPVRVKVNETMFDPVDLTVPVLGRVKRDTEQVSDKLLAKAVITTPACATHSYRQDLLEAASRADIKVIGLLNETTAAGLYWSYSVEPKFEGMFVALSLGQQHWEASLLTRHEKLLEVRGHICRPAPPVTLDCAPHSRQVFEELITQLLEETITDPQDVKVVITAGRAGTELFDLSEAYHTVLPKARVTSRLDHRAASAGAAIFAALIVRQAKDLAIWDCVATATLVGEEFAIKPLIAEQSPVPISGHFNFKATADKAQFQVVQRASREDSRSVCCVVVEDIPATTEAPRNIDIEVHATADGVLSFNARDIQLDSNLRIKVEPVLTEYDVIELVKIEDKLLPDEASPDRSPSGICQTGLIIVNTSGKWVIELALFGSTVGIVPGQEILEIDGIPVKDLPENPNAYLIGPTTKFVKLTLKDENDAPNTVSVQCGQPIDAWKALTLEPIITDAVLAGDQARLVTATIMYAHAAYIHHPERAEEAYNRAVEIAQRELGTQDALYTLALSRKAWFHAKRYDHFSVLNRPDSLKHHLGEVRRTVIKLAGTDLSTATDAHAKYIIEVAGAIRKYLNETLLFDTAIAIAKAAKLPQSIIETYEQKLHETDTPSEQ